MLVRKQKNDKIVQIKKIYLNHLIYKHFSH